jgi:L-tartrate/succinate antiporter
VVAACLPLAIGAIIALTPVPDGLAANAWRYFALFVTVIAGIITEPIPPAVLGLAGVIVAALLGLVRDTPAQSASWALSGFANTTVWLIFAGYMFALGYAETGLGRRIALLLVRALGRRTLGLGYAVTCADLVLAPFTASATARSGGTIYPVIRNIPDLYGSRPEDGTARRIGAYLLYTALASSTITSSMFITAMAPNTLAVDLVRQTVGVSISWVGWFVGFAPIGLTLLLVMPLVVYAIYPPEIRVVPEAAQWAATELRTMGPMTRRERVLLALVLVALVLWIGGTSYLDPALAAVLVVLLMVVCCVVTWNQVIGNAQAWNVLVWFGSLVTLAAGLAETKFVDWLARGLAPLVEGFPLWLAVTALVGTFFFLHYFFASITAHTAALLPVFLTVAVTIPGLSPMAWALLLVYAFGLMSILTPYAAGQNPIYYGSGYISRRSFWTLGFTLGIVFLVVYLVMVLPWLSWLGV